jgi:hypothetical protein
MLSKLLAIYLPFVSLVSPALALNFTIENGQIYTPGFAILDSPQPGTPLGGGEFIVTSEPENRVAL